MEEPVPVGRSAAGAFPLTAGLPSLPPSPGPGPAEAGVRGGLALGHSAGPAPPRTLPGQATRRPEPGAPASGCRPAPAARPAFTARSAPVPPPGGFRFRFSADVVEENESGRGQDWRSCRFRRGAQNTAATSLERGPWGRSPRRARWQHTLGPPLPAASPEDGQQRNKKMDSLAAGELNASHQPWVPEFVAYWRKTHQEVL
ncbi:transcription factor ATOH8 isoform X3 [Gorilla gorilla gorilla]|uniref:transcription factor ATOH8 isoform X3 n=1 Tax=Gorilla gorilla gorilla TaxID=9595 RepID=UPI00300AB39B